jgi:sulfatase modifying factor 1
MVVGAPLLITGFALAGLAAGGCTKQASDGQAVAEDGRALVAARLPLGHGKQALRHGRNAREAHTLTGSGGPGLLSFGARVHAETPLEQLLAEGDRPLEKNGLCPPDMASVDDLYCVDRYEASILEVLPNGEERPWTAFEGVEGHVARAVSEPQVFPQGYISANQAQEACSRSGKRLCKPAEWRKACMGPGKSTYGYGAENQPRRCNDSGKSPMVAVWGSSVDLNDPMAWSWDRMNDPSLNQLKGGLAKTGAFESCENGYGIHDMVGNLHEWVDDPAGTFLGGYYLDTHLNGDGCQYRTMAHEAWYHDYSTGFRCCADVAP